MTLNEISIDSEIILTLIIKVVFVLFLYFSMFSRKFGILGFSGGMTAALFSVVIFSLSILVSYYLKEDFVISQLAALTIIFLVILGITPIVSSFFYDIQSGIIIRLLAEVAVVVFIFLATYNFIRSKVISPRFFLYTIAILGSIAALITLRDLIGAIVVRRTGNISGVNYVGTTFGMSAITWVMILYSNTLSQRTKKMTSLKVIAFIIVFFGMLFTGTRSATIAFFIGLILLQVFGIKSKKFKKYLILLTLVLGLIITIIALNIDLSRLWDRYSIDQVLRMAIIRFNIYASSVTDMTLLEFFVGRPDLYIFHSDLTGARFINTHNLFLSLIRYHGIFVFILYIALLFVIIKNYLKLNFIHKNQPLYRVSESSIIVLFAMALVYTMFSGGRPTRAFSLFITLGYFVGYFELLKNVKTVDEYKKMIL